MKYYLYTTLLLILFILTACNKIITYPFDEQVKIYRNNNPLSEIETMELDYKIAVKTDSGNCFIPLLSGDKYSLGIFEWYKSSVSVERRPLILNKETGKYEDIYSLLINKIKSKTGKVGSLNIIIDKFPNNYEMINYYNPFTDKYEEVFKIKEINENNVTLAILVSDTTYVNGIHSLWPHYISIELFNELLSVIEDETMKENIMSAYQIKTKAYGQPENNPTIDEQYYSKINPHGRFYDLFDRMLYNLGYTNKTFRKDAQKLGLPKPLIGGCILELTFTLKDDELDTSYEMIYSNLD